MRFAILVIFIFFCSCDANLKYGNISNKAHHPESEYYTIYFTQVGDVQVPCYQWWHQGESWSIKVVGVDKNGDSGSATYYIPQSQWDTLSVGRFICVDGMCKEDSALRKINK